MRFAIARSVPERLRSDSRGLRVGMEFARLDSSRDLRNSLAIFFAYNYA